MTAIIGFLTSRIGLAGIGVLALVVMYGAWSSQVASKDRAIARLEDRIDNPDPEKGYIAKVAQLRSYIAGYKRNEDVYIGNQMIFRMRIAKQNEAVAMWKAEAERRQQESLEARRESDIEREAAGRLASEIIAMRPSANAVLDANLFILRAVQ